MTTNVADVV